MIKRFPLLSYFALVFGVEWLLFFHLASLTPPLIALLIGSWLPNLTGLLVTGLAGGRAGLRELFGRVVRWRIGFHWYGIAFGGAHWHGISCDRSLCALRQPCACAPA